MANRRIFLKNALSISAFSCIDPRYITSNAFPGHFTNAPLNNNADAYTVLFQGDSITDGNRTRNQDWNHVMGHGFAYLIASRLWCDYPRKGFHFYNRGISGNKVTDLAQRWQQDTVVLKPNLLSILIGINDLAAWMNNHERYTAEQYEKEYRSLLLQTKERLPGSTLVICEPFILPVGRIKERWQEYADEIKKRQQIAASLSKDFNAIFIPFQQVFNKALAKAPAEYWIWDGIHPMPAGHELMARAWIKEVKSKIKIFR